MLKVFENSVTFVVLFLYIQNMDSFYAVVISAGIPA
jgi:hypothetical protein